MFYTEPFHLQRGAGVFEVDRYPLQRGRGLGGIFANLLRKIIPYGKTFVKAATSSGKKVLSFFKFQTDHQLAQAVHGGAWKAEIAWSIK